MKIFQVLLFLVFTQTVVGQALDSTAIRTKIDSLTSLSNTQYGEQKFGESAQSRLEAIPHIRALSNWKEMASEYNFIFFIANADDNLTVSESALDSALHISNTYLSDLDIEKSYVLANVAYHQYSNANYEKAIEFYEDAIAGFRKHNTPFQDYYHNIITLLQSYRLKGNIDYCLKIAESIQAYADSVPEAHNYIKPDLLTYKAIFLRKNEQYEKALEILAEATEFQKIITDPYYKQSIKTNILRAKAFTHMRKKDFALALQYFNQVNQLQLQNSKKLRFYNHSDIGRTYSENLDFSNAIPHFRSAIKSYNLKKIKNEKHNAILHSKLAYAYFKTNQLDSAKFYFKASEELLQIPLAQNLSKIEDYDHLGDFNENTIQAISRIAEFNNHLAQINKDANLKENAIRRYKQAFNGSQYMQRELMSNTSKYMLNKNIQEHFSDYVELLLERYNADPSSETFLPIFQIAENNKAITLKEDLHEKTVLLQSQIPENLLSKETNFHSSINDVRKKIHKYKQQKIQEETILQKWESDLLNLTRDYADFQKSLESEYPKYYEKKYTLSNASLKTLQENLAKDDIYINYFTTEDELYYAWVSQNNNAIHKIGDKEKVFELVRELNLLIQSGNKNSASASYFEMFKQNAHELYTLLIPDACLNKGRLIISPASHLHYLPFETLIEKGTGSEKTYKDFKYLLRSKKIEYSFSSDLWIESKTKQNSNSELTVHSFAPFVSKTNDLATRSCSTTESFEGLPCSENEILEITKYFTNQHHIGTKASLGNFKDISNSDIIHLATHACLDNTDPSFNKLIFADDQLSLLDLENMQIDAELAILSACNTGTGKLESGEGVINLGKGFRKAGIKSLISSLWALNDCATAKVVGNFYKELESTKDISGSLRQAKLNYISSADKRHAHPYYWAGLVFTGDSHAFKNPNTSLANLIYPLIAAISCLILLFFYYQRK